MNLDMVRIRQKFSSKCVNDVEGEVLSQLDRLELKIKPGSRIAITAGSRGISRIPLIIRTVVRWVRDMGGEPFIVPAMGSHGGSTAAGQAEVLKKLGITPEYAGAPIVSSMKVVQVGKLEDGIEVCMDENAFSADGVIVVNRVKPHTSFHGEIESGMMKMMAVGLGKAIQAKKLHSLGPSGLRDHIVPAAKSIMSTGKIMAAIGIVENAYGGAAEIRGFLPEDIECGEKELLKLARKHMPSLPVEDIDILIVEQMGKNISGTGMDTNVVGRLRIPGIPEPEKPRIKRIIVLDLTPETGGNALGMGLADITVRALADKIDFEATYANVLTTTFLERGKIPVIAKDEEQALEYALRSCNITEPEAARIVKIKNTLELEEMLVSRNVFEELKCSPNIEEV